MGNAKPRNTRFLCELEPRRMFKFGSMFLVFVCTFLLEIFDFIFKYVYRLKSGVIEEKGSNFSANHSHKDDRIVHKNSNLIMRSGSAGKGSLGLQKSKNFIAETEDSVFCQSKCQFVSGGDVIGYIEEPKTLNFTVMDMFVGSSDVFIGSNRSCDREMSQGLEENLLEFDEETESPSFTFKLFSSSTGDIQGHKQERENICREKTEELFINLLGEDVRVEEEELGAAASEEFKLLEDEIIDSPDFSYEVEFLSSGESSSIDVSQDSDAAQTCSSISTPGDSDTAQVDGLTSTPIIEPSNEASIQGNDCKIWDFFLDSSDEENPEVIGEDHDIHHTRVDVVPSGTPDTLGMPEQTSASPMSEDDKSESRYYPTRSDIIDSLQGTERAEDDGRYHGIDCMHSDVMSDEIRTRERRLACALSNNDSHGLRNDQTELDMRNYVQPTERFADLDADDDCIELEPLSQICREDFVCGDGNENEELDRHDSDSDNEDEPDVLKEHQNLVQQMKMEMKNCRVRGLPTISEECETPRMVDDLKPLEIDRKFEYKDVMEEIQKFYMRYLDKMRKLDIVNYQTLQGISFIQLKESEVFTAGKKKSSVSLMLPKILACKVQRIYAAPMNKSITGMHQDLELVYVGQLCLSWEILCWLHVKAGELLEYDCKGNHSYNRVAEEFQQFQVLMQRFMEDEPFRGQRVQNYARSRCMLRSLLQVPTVKDDCLKDKKERREDTDAISLELVVDTIWESMLLFSQFLGADKRSTNAFLKGFHRTKADLQDPSHSELLVDVITNLQKKERRIREHMRSKNCIVKKLKKHQGCQLNPELFKSQVELKLVSRVLGLPRLTADHLAWCQMKLNSINFVGKEVHLEPSFLLFPC